MQPEDLVKGVVRLVPLPELFIQLNRMVGDPRSTAADMAAVVARDPTLTARLLRIANSPFYGFPSRIDTVPRAVTVIGTRGLRDLALAASTVDVFSRLSGNFLEMSTFWRHSLYCGVTARLIGIRRKVIHSESLFAAGLLHDIGQLIILSKLPEMGREAHLRAVDTGTPLFVMEKEVIGFDHAEVGGALLCKWRLPRTLCDAVRWHHMPRRAEHASLETAIIHVANAVTALKFPLLTRDNRRAPVADVTAPVDDAAHELVGLSGSELDDISSEAERQFSSLAETLLVKAA